MIHFLIFPLYYGSSILSSKWRLRNEYDVRDSWEIAELTFFGDEECHVSIPGGQSFSSGYAPGHDPGYAFDNDITTTWRTPLPVTIADPGYLGREYATPRYCKCVRLRHTKNRHRASAIVIVESWEDPVWILVETFEVLNLGVWINLPLAFGFSFRITHQEPIYRRWVIRHLSFYETANGDVCGSEITNGIWIGSGYTDDHEFVQVEGDIDTYWESQCFDCRKEKAWIGLGQMNGKYVSCLKIYFGEPREDLSTHITLEEMVGGAWKINNHFHYLSGQQYLTLDNTWHKAPLLHFWRLWNDHNCIIQNLSFHLDSTCRHSIDPDIILASNYDSGNDPIHVADTEIIPEGADSPVPTVWSSSITPQWIGYRFKILYDFRCVTVLGSQWNGVVRWDLRDENGEWITQMEYDISNVYGTLWIPTFWTYADTTEKKINFQDTVVDTPHGFFMDDGTGDFEERQVTGDNHFATFGWTCKQEGQYFDRFDNLELDTCIRLTCPQKGEWNMAVLNGHYYIALIYYDATLGPGELLHTEGCTLEGKNASVAGDTVTLTAEKRTYVMAEVVDGTITFAGSALTDENRCDAITSLKSTPLPPTKSIWRLRNGAMDQLDGVWDVVEMEMHEKADCTNNLLVTDVTLESWNTLNPTQSKSVEDLYTYEMITSGMSDSSHSPYNVVDLNEGTSWQSHCKNCREKQAFIGVTFGAFPNVDVRCIRLLQNMYAAPTVYLEYWDYTQWIEIHQYDGLVSMPAWNIVNKLWDYPEVNQRWRILTSEVIDIEFHRDVSCPLGLSSSEISGVPIGEGDPTQLAFDKDSDAIWKGEWVGLHMVSSTQVLCVAALGAKDICTIERWDPSSSWQFVASFNPRKYWTFAHFFDVQPIEKMKMWKIEMDVPLEQPWTILEIKFYDFADCQGDELQGSPFSSSTWKTIHDIRKAFDNGLRDNSEGFVAGCVPCQAGNEFVGILLNTPADVKCITIYQAPLTLLGVRAAELVSVHRWNPEWEKIGEFGNVTPLTGGTWHSLYIMANQSLRYTIRSNRWRVVNGEDIVGNWAIAEIAMSRLIECIDPMPASASALSFDTHVPLHAIDRDINTMWWSPKGPKKRKAQLELSFSSHIFTRCVRLLQDPSRLFSTPIVQLQAFQDDRWMHIHTFHVHPGVWDHLLLFQYMSREAQTLWRLRSTNMNPFILAEIEVYSDQKCAIIEPTTTFSTGEFGSARILDNLQDLQKQTVWGPPCLDDPCAEAWIGFSFSTMQISGTNQIREERSLMVECIIFLSQSSGDLSLEYWDGNQWSVSQQYFQVSGGKYIRLMRESAKFEIQERRSADGGNIFISNGGNTFVSFTCEVEDSWPEYLLEDLILLDDFMEVAAKAAQKATSIVTDAPVGNIIVEKRRRTLENGKLYLFIEIVTPGFFGSDAEYAEQSQAALDEQIKKQKEMMNNFTANTSEDAESTDQPLDRIIDPSSDDELEMTDASVIETTEDEGDSDDPGQRLLYTIDELTTEKGDNSSEGTIALLYENGTIEFDAVSREKGNNDEAIAALPYENRTINIEDNRMLVSQRDYFNEMYASFSGTFDKKKNDMNTSNTYDSHVRTLKIQDEVRVIHQENNEIKILVKPRILQDLENNTPEENEDNNENIDVIENDEDTTVPEEATIDPEPDEENSVDIETLKKNTKDPEKIFDILREIIEDPFGVKALLYFENFWTALRLETRLDDKLSNIVTLLDPLDKITLRDIDISYALRSTTTTTTPKPEKKIIILTDDTIYYGAGIGGIFGLLLIIYGIYRHHRKKQLDKEIEELWTIATASGVGVLSVREAMEKRNQMQNSTRKRKNTNVLKRPWQGDSSDEEDEDSDDNPKTHKIEILDDFIQSPIGRQASTRL